MTPPPTPPNIDIVTLAIALAAVLFSRETSEVVGPYAVILFCALLGAGWSASRRTQNRTGSTLFYMLGIVGLAVVITVPAAQIVAEHWGLERRWTLGPVALVIGGIGRDWPRVGRWALNTAREALEAAARRWGRGGTRGPGEPAAGDDDGRR